MSLTPEALARQQIDAQLVAAGWIIQDYRAVDFSAGRGIVLREVPLKTGPCDYLLLVDRHAVGVIEAKKEGTTLSIVADQSARYGSSLPDFLAAGLTGPLPFLYESTGVETFFRDTRDPDPRSRRVFCFHRPETLAAWHAEADTLRARLVALPTTHPLVTTGMRDCQVEAITGLEKSFAENRPRSLIHMATGAGKTYTACAFTYRLIKYAGARRVLFLVDRANLGEQARDEFARFRTPDTGRLFTELYNVQHLTSPHIDDVCRVTIIGKPGDPNQQAKLNKFAARAWATSLEKLGSFLEVAKQHGRDTASLWDVTVGARTDAGVNRAIGAYNWGKFDGSDLATLRGTLERSLPPSATSGHTVHVIVQHFGLTFTNNRGACLALIDWCVVDGPQIIMSERFYAAYDTGDKLFGTETMGMAKNRVLHAAAARIAERSLAAANGLPAPPSPSLTFNDPASANATLPQHMTAVAGPSAVSAAVQQTMLGGLEGATRLLPDPLPPAPDWPSLLQ